VLKKETDLIIKINKSLNALVSGDLSTKQTPKEVGEFEQTFLLIAELKASFKNITGKAKQITEGSYTEDIEPRSDKDELGVAMAKIASTFKQTRQYNDFDDLMSALNTTALISETDNLGRITRVNKNFEAISQYSSEELIGKDHRILNSGEHPKAFFKNVWDTIKRGDVWIGEIKNQAKDGSYYWVNTTLYPRFDAEGKINGFMSFRFDITQQKNIELNLLEEKKRSEQASIEQKRQYKELAELTNALDETALISETDSRGRITRVNQNFENISQYSSKELIGKDHRILNSGEHPKDFFKNVWDTIKQGDVWIGEIKNQAKDGSYYWVNTTLYPRFDAEGKINGFMSFRFDITQQKNIELNLLEEKKRSEQASIEQKRQYKELAELTNALDETALISETDSRGRITRVNQNFENISQYSSKELIGKDHRILNSGEHPKDFFKNVWDTIKQGDVWIGEIKNQAKDGSYYWVNTTLYPRFDAEGKINGFMSFRFDITQQKNIELNLLEEKKRSEQASIEQKRQYKELAELTNALDETALISETDSRGRITRVNQNFENISQYSSKELIGKDHRILNSGEHPKDFFKNVWDTIKRGDVWIGEIKNQAKDGSFYWVNSTLYPRFDTEGEISGFVSFRFDITEKKNLELHLIEEKMRAEKTLGLNTELVNTISAQANQISDGDFSAQIVPSSDDDILGIAMAKMTDTLRYLNTENQKQDWLKTGQNEINALMRGVLDETILSKNIITFLAKYLGAQMGALYLKATQSDDLKLTGSYAFSKRNSLNETIQMGEGLVGQAALEQEVISITNVPDNYARIGSAIGDAVPRNVVISPFMSDGTLKGVIELCSFKEFSDTEMELLATIRETLSINFNAAKSASEMKVLLEESQRQAEELENQSEELRASNEELEEKSESLVEQTEQLRFANDDLEVQKIEITRKNKEVEKKAEELTTYSKYKSEFLANMSHELRTPLNSMLLLSNSLSKNKEGNLTSKQVQSASIVHQGGQDLLILINEILDLSKIEAGMMELEITAVAMTDVAESMERNFSHMMKEKGLEFIINTEPNLPDIVYTDQKRLEQVLKNLLSNAIKFTETGSICVNFSRINADNNSLASDLPPSNYLSIAVTDTGIGITKDKQKMVFGAFQQAEGGTARKFGGTGLGLSISRELTKLLGGYIQLQSEMGKGSTFTFTIPLDREKRGIKAVLLSDRATILTSDKNKMQSADVAETEVAKQSTAVIPPINYHVEDDRELILDKNSLSHNKKVMLVIEDDPKFAQILVSQSREQGFVCIATSTGEEGLTLAAQILPNAIILDINLPGIDGWSVLNALKAFQKTRHIPVHVMTADDKNQNAEIRGAIGFVSKPVSLDQLDETLTTLIDLSNKAVKDLLIIEDNESSQIAIKELIGNGDVKITAALTGYEGFKAILSENFDCVILDLNLQDMSGFEMLEKLALEKNIKIPPIIIYTGKDLGKEEHKKLLKYSDSIIIKGVDSEERLLDETALFLHRVIEKLPQDKQRIIHDLHDVEKVFKGKKILVVDDDIRNIFALSEILEEKGIEVLAAENGEVALELLNKNPLVDLVLMDIMMPVMDGYETTQKIRKQVQFIKLPIIALTAKAMKEDRNKCIAAGASDYLTKPVDEARLFSMLRIWMY
jgi:PAS domain S-box-containing protein